jgi:redox-sensitive bicupin YhaK (pirin superfamily)
MMRQHTRLAFALGLLAAARLGAQNTQASFENDQVIINAPHPGVDVPGSTHKMHDHKLNRVMVYLHPGGELLHYLDGHTEDLKWQAGQVKWSPASGMHYSEIPTTSDVPRGSGLLDIGIKRPGIPGKVVSAALDPSRVDPRDFKLEFENNQVRVVRLKLGPRQSVPMHEYRLDHVVYYVTDENVRETSSDGKSVVVQHKAGDFSWDGPAKHKVENLNGKPFEALVVEVKN